MAIQESAKKKRIEKLQTRYNASQELKSALELYTRQVGKLGDHGAPTAEAIDRTINRINSATEEVNNSYEKQLFEIFKGKKIPTPFEPGKIDHLYKTVKELLGTTTTQLAELGVKVGNSTDPLLMGGPTTGKPLITAANLARTRIQKASSKVGDAQLDNMMKKSSQHKSTNS